MLGSLLQRRTRLLWRRRYTGPMRPRPGLRSSCCTRAAELIPSWTTGLAGWRTKATSLSCSTASRRVE